MSSAVYLEFVDEIKDLNFRMLHSTELTVEELAGIRYALDEFDEAIENIQKYKMNEVIPPYLNMEQQEKYYDSGEIEDAEILNKLDRIGEKIKDILYDDIYRNAFNEED